jgi:(2Fe-2S) ferredoxin
VDLKKNSEIAKASLVRKKLDNLPRDIFLCVGEKCCSHLSESERDELWEYLKTLTRESTEVNRFSTKCLRVCAVGPIVKTYPDGTWYHSMGREQLSELVKSGNDSQGLAENRIL